MPLFSRRKFPAAASVLNLLSFKHEHDVGSSSGSDREVVTPLEEKDRAAAVVTPIVETHPSPTAAETEAHVEKKSSQEVTKTHSAQSSEIVKPSRTLRLESGLSLRRKKGEWKEKLERLEDENHTLDNTIRILQDASLLTEERNRTLEDRNEALELQVRTLLERNGQLEKEVERLRKGAESTQPQRNIGVQASVVEPNSLPVAEVVEMIDALNKDIYQTAVFVADSFEYEIGMKDVDERDMVTAGHYIGQDMIRQLSSLRDDDETSVMLLQVAVQACMTLFSAWIISSWLFDHNQTEEFLNDIHKQVQKTEIQVVSGRWRTLTRAHVQRMLGKDSGIPVRLTSDIIAAISSVLATSGCDSSHIPEVLRTRVSGVVELALRINEAIGRDVTSVDLETVIIPAEQEFDPAHMIGAYGRDAGRVMCTTSLGMRCATWRELEPVVLVKAEVALDTSVVSEENW